MTTTTTTTVKTTETTPSEPHIVSYVQQEAGLLVTNELEKAIEECRARVERIAKNCQAKNRKFRDIEFDLENDKNRCLYGLFTQPKENHSPADVHRVTQIFDKPQFFVDGVANSNDIIQGSLGDCWFLSALATVSTAPGLIEKLCVARDESVGVYGFIFFRDNGWVTVIIDDMLYTRVPKYEELKQTEQELYHYDKDAYNKSARKGGKSLYFAKSGIAGETWVPLIEKAYAKLHGNYSHLIGGVDSEAIEDLTGGVSSILESKDILDLNRFWDEELCRANKDRLFGCSFNALDNARSGASDVKVQGLIGGHSYSVLRAVECNGKRFVVIRNPWGMSEWTGRWSDGSKEWTQPWLEMLSELGHQFGEDGQFVMEYKDWLDAFSQIDRTILFDSNWSMASQWLRVDTQPLPAPWSYGHVSFRFSISQPTTAVIVLSQLDTRYFRDISGTASWSVDFSLVKEGEKEELADSFHSEFFLRSANLEIDLEAGNYIVYVRLDRSIDRNEGNDKVDEWQLRKLSRIIAERAKSQSIASNFKHEDNTKHLTKGLAAAIQEDLDEIEKKNQGDSVSTETTEEGEDGTITTTTTVTTKVEKVVTSKKSTPSQPPKFDSSGKGELSAGVSPTTPHTSSDSHDPNKLDNTERQLVNPREVNYGDTPPALDVEKGKLSVPHDSPDSVYIGLRVYTNKEVTTCVTGRVKEQPETPKAPTTVNP